MNYLTTISYLLVLIASSCFHEAVSLTLTDQRAKQQRPPSQSRPRHHPSTSSATSRRDMILFPYFTSFLIPTTIVNVAMSSYPANALVEQCKQKSHNCIRTQWMAPNDISTPSQAVTTLREVLNSYPQNGQAGVDCNGWTIVNDNINEDASIISLAIEYKSCVGPAALAINFGQPFTDDLKLEIATKNAKMAIPSGNGGNYVVVDVKSSSRMGSGDLFVNKKRLKYLGSRLRERGWIVPPPKYVYEK